VNRQFLPDVYRETGAIIACQRNVLKSDSRIGKKIGLHIIDDDRSIDVDNHRDLWLCELILKKKRVAIVVIGNSTVGMGHVYRTLMLAHELIRHEVIFICRDSDTLAIEYISKHNYKMVIARHGDFLREIRSLQPDMVINDILDTSADYIRQLKEMVPYVVNFEDMGIGAEAADLVINALYPHHFPQNHILVGQKYYCLRDEFFHIKSKEKCNSVGNILVTFGGVDEGNITCRIIDLLASIASNNKIEINVVLGPGYVHQADLKHLLQRHEPFRVNIINATNRISDYMNSADLAITSGGRTVYELLSLAVPTLVISQNLRETTHAFASSQNGVVNLGLHTELADETIRDMIKRLLTDSRLRKTMVKKMNKLDLRAGKKRVLDRINTLLG
jgi:spore coat polysaccharide biosynthesis predicted glycosyltransferase SpsG